MLCPISESICVVCGVHAWCCARLHVVYTCSLCSALCIVVCAHIYSARNEHHTHRGLARTMRYYRLHVFDLCSLLKNQNGTGERHTIGTPQYTHTTAALTCHDTVDHLFRYPPWIACSLYM